MDTIQDNINKLKITVPNLNTEYKILYKNSSFLNDSILLDNDTKKVFNIHFLNKNKYSLGDIYELYLEYLNNKKLLDDDFVNLDIILKENLNTDKNTLLLNDFFKLIKIKFIENFE